MMTREQIEAAKLNPDLRKKLIVDRIKRKTMGQKAFDTKKKMSSVVEDPDETEWNKEKSLREIEHLRKLKKDLMISSMVTDNAKSSTRIHLCPGEVNFFTLPLENTNGSS